MIRTCTECGDPFDLPVPYEKANPKIRDICMYCLHEISQDDDKIKEVMG